MKVTTGGTLKILVIRLSSLGDVVLTSALIESLRAQFPSAVIDMLTREQFAPILRGFDGLNRELEYSSNFFKRIRLRRGLRRRRYDVVFDLQNNLRSRMLVAALSPAKVFRYHRPRLNRFMRIHFPPVRSRLKVPNFVSLNYVDCARGLGIRPTQQGIRLSVADDWTNSVQGSLDAFRRRCGFADDAKPLIAAPGARHRTKIMPLGKWAALLTQASEEGFPFQIIVGGRDDVSLAEDIEAQIAHPVLNLAGTTGPGEFAALIDVAAAVVSSDSAAVHIAGAVGTPVVAIYGPTVPAFGFAPQGQGSSGVVEVPGLTCRPCHPHGEKRCPRGHFRCMNDIEPEEIIRTLRQVAGKLTPIPALTVEA